MGRPGRPKSNKLAEDIKEQETGPETPVATPVDTPLGETVRLKTPCDTTIYHNELEPRNMKAGEEIPEGWTDEPSTLKVQWSNRIDGSWIKQSV